MLLSVRSRGNCKLPSLLTRNVRAFIEGLTRVSKVRSLYCEQVENVLCAARHACTFHVRAWGKTEKALCFS